MREKLIKYQSIKVNFPERLYLITSWLNIENGTPFIFPHLTLYVDPKKGLRQAKKIYKVFTKEGKSVSKMVIINPLDLIESVPLKNDFWKTPAFDFDGITRMNQFISSYLKHKEYKLLVTPFNAKKNIFTAAMPFRKDTGEKEYDLFMSTSNWQVDQEADSAALYSMGDSIGVDIFSKEIFRKDKAQYFKTRVN